MLLLYITVRQEHISCQHIIEVIKYEFGKIPQQESENHSII